MWTIEITDSKNKIHKYHTKTSQSIRWMVEGHFILICDYYSYKVIKRINISRFGGVEKLHYHEEM